MGATGENPSLRIRKGWIMERDFRGFRTHAVVFGPGLRPSFVQLFWLVGEMMCGDFGWDHQEY